MADIQKLFDISIQSKSFYHAGVLGAEIYMGIRRSDRPDWCGWAIIDLVKQANPMADVPTLNVLFKQNKELLSEVITFYKCGYWTPCK
ncbi:MAG: hypothetical protein JWP44_1820 [Mucilaginibacter sp.]|nr:hypothetical protein [Mucilaginibacter sp.]